VSSRSRRHPASPPLPEELDLPPPRWVQTPAELSDMLDRLMSEPRVAVDTEADSLFVYHYKVCLIQFSTPDVDYLVDPLALDDLSPLGELFATPRVEKVFHAAENDILMLKRGYQFRFANLFDTMIAARILGWPRVGLAALLEDRFGIRLDKRMQRTNWGQRPLSPEQMAYARLDTRYLLPLRDLLYRELLARGRLEEALDAFEALTRVEYVEKPFDPEGFLRINGARDLTPRQLTVLRELYLWREECARRVNLPPFKVLSDRALVLLSQHQPTTLQALRRLPGLLGALRARRGGEILAAIRRGRRAPLWTPSPRQPNGSLRPDEATWARYERLREWRSRKARERGVDLDVVLTNDVLLRIAREAPQSMEELERLGLLSPWKLHSYGPELLKVMR